MNGYLPINKPSGMTSHDVVMRIRRTAETKKVGHTGTLDPMAEGLMLICIGKCTKASSYITAFDKGYIARAKLGTTSDTYDITGEISNTPDFNINNFSKDKISDALLSFIGVQEQYPPMYSAKKVDGKKLYELAREGKTADIKPCEIEIYDIKILNIENDEIEFYAHCSKGTYIRSLIHDFGAKLGCGALMSYLKRTETNGFSLDNDNILPLDAFSNKETIKNALLPPDSIFGIYRKIVLSPICERFFKNGIPINLIRAGINEKFENGEYVRIYNESGDFLALCSIYDDVFLKLMITFFDN